MVRRRIPCLWHTFPESPCSNRATWRSSANNQKKWIDEEPTFHGKYSTVEKARASVIFELFNEPAPIGGQPVDWREWKEWRDKLTVLIDKIRTFAPNTLILVSGWQWTYDLRCFAKYPIERDDIAHVAHVYPNHKKWEDYFGFLSYTRPVIVTEWGFSPTVSPTENYYGTREKFGEPFLRYMEDKNISWIAWCFHPAWQPNMIMNWNLELTEEGRLVKQALVANSTLPTVLSKLPPTRLLLSEK